MLSSVVSRTAGTVMCHAMQKQLQSAQGILDHFKTMQRGCSVAQRLQPQYNMIANEGLDCSAAQAQGWGHAVLCPLSGIALAGASCQLCHHWICKLWHHANAGTTTPCHLLRRSNANAFAHWQCILFLMSYVQVFACASLHILQHRSQLACVDFA